MALRALYLASGMAFSLFTLVPGLLFSANPILSAAATRPIRFPALRTYDFASLQKNVKFDRFLHFGGLPSTVASASRCEATAGSSMLTSSALGVRRSQI